MVCDNLDWWNLCSDDSNNVLSWFKHHHKNTTTQTPPHKHHHTNTTTQTPPQKHHHKITTTKSPTQQHHHKHQHKTTNTKTLQYHSILQSTTSVLQSTTPYYKVLLHYYKVLFQYYSVLQSTTPVVLLQYYSSSTTPVLLQYYKVLLQYYSVLQSSTPVRQYYKSSNARPIRDRSETVPSMLRDRLRQSATRHATEVAFRAPDERFVLKNTTFRAPAIFPNFTKSCAYH